MMNFTNRYLNREIANSVSHGFGVLFSIVAIPVLMALTLKTGSLTYVIATGVYSMTLLMVFLSSTLYHSFQQRKVKRILRILDHIAIYFLIAGSYTPFIFLFLDRGLGWTMFAIIWGLVLFGSVWKIFYVNRFDKISTALYLVMGWMIIIIAKPVVSSIPIDCLIWLAIGGAFYTLGIIFYLWHKFTYHHLIWHLFVLGGSISHYIAVIYAVLDKV